MVDDRLKHVAQGQRVVPLRRGGHPDHQRAVVLPGTTVGEDTLVGRRRRVVRFIDHDRGKVRRKTGQALRAGQRLYTGDNGRSGRLIAVGFDDAHIQRGIDQPKLLDGLLDELIAVRQDETTAAALAYQQDKDDRLPGTGGQRHE